MINIIKLEKKLKNKEIKEYYLAVTEWPKQNQNVSVRI
jgi:hypothetical protein